MRSACVGKAEIEKVLAALTDENRRVMRVCLETGLRVSDVLSLRTEQIQKQRFTVRESKTGKSRRIRLSAGLWDDLLLHAGRYWVFESRCDIMRHRTRQAVWKDVRRAAVAFRLRDHVSPHSARKAYATDLLNRGYSLEEVSRKLNHSDYATTLVYLSALSVEAASLVPRRSSSRAR